MLDPTEQRIVGVLVEKELAVPDTYPLTENALLAGCNQKSNRDPEMSLEAFQVSGALRALLETEWVTRTERDGGRTVRYRHRLEEKLGSEPVAKPILAELLLRGPQAPGALKTRVARMGMHASPEQILDLLGTLRQRSPPLVEQLPRQPRERDARWAHCMAKGGQGAEPGVLEPAVVPTAVPPTVIPPTAVAPTAIPPTAVHSTAAPSTSEPRVATAPRVATLEERVADPYERNVDVEVSGKITGQSR